MDIFVQIIDQAPSGRLSNCARHCLRRRPGNSVLHSRAAKDAGIMSRTLVPPPILVIAGAGHVGQALGRLRPFLIFARP